MNIVELFAQIGLKADTAKAEQFLGTTKAIATGLKAAVAGAAAFSIAIGKITADAQKAALEFKKFETDTGSSAAELQKWSAVANQVSGSGQAVADSIRAISDNQEKIKLGQGNISGYQLLGIDPRSDPFEVIKQIKAKTEGLSQSMKRNIMGQFGLSKDLLSTLELTTEEFDAMAARAFVIPKETIQTIDKARMSTTELTQGLSYMRAQIAANLSPAISELTKRASDFIRANEDGIIKTIRKAFDWINRFVTAIGRAGIMIDRMIRGSIGWGNALKGVIALLAVMNAAFLASPMGLFIAGIVLLIAILDDLYVYSSGKGRSMIGLLFEKFPNFEKAIKNIVDAFNDLMKNSSALLGDEAAIDRMIEKWGAFGNAVAAVGFFVRDLKDYIKSLSDLGAVDDKMSALGREAFEDAGRPKNFFEDPAGTLKMMGNVLIGSLNPKNWNITDSERALIEADMKRRYGGAPTENTSTVTATINVNGVTNPAVTANAVNDRLQQALNQAEAQRTRGGATR